MKIKREKKTYKEPCHNLDVKNERTIERMIIEHNWMEFSTNDSVQIYIQKGTRKKLVPRGTTNAIKYCTHMHAYCICEVHHTNIFSAPGQQLIKSSPKHLSTKWYFQLIFPLKFLLSVDHVTHIQSINETPKILVHFLIQWLVNSFVFWY